MGLAEYMPVAAFTGCGAIWFAPSRSDRFEAPNTLSHLSELKIFLVSSNLIEYAVNKQMRHCIGMENFKRIKTMSINTISSSNRK